MKYVPLGNKGVLQSREIVIISNLYSCRYIKYMYTSVKIPHISSNLALYSISKRTVSKRKPSYPSYVQISQCLKQVPDNLKNEVTALFKGLHLTRYTD